MFSFKWAGFSLAEVWAWEWSVLSGSGKARRVSGEPAAVFVKPSYIGSRIRAQVSLANGQILTKTSFPVITAKTYSDQINLDHLRDLSATLADQTAELAGLLKDIRQERKKLRAENDVDAKLELSVKLSHEIESKRTQLLRERAELEKRTKYFEQTLKKQRDFLVQKEADVLQEWRAFQERTDLVARMNKVDEMIESVENAWDILDKANHLKLKLSLEARDQVLEIIKKESDQARKQNLRKSDGTRGTGLPCAFCNSANSQFFSWAAVCPDHSK
jgi:hypothetical protein